MQTQSERKNRTEKKRKEKKRQQNKRKQMKITSMHRHAGMHMHRPSCCTSWDWYCKASTCSESCQQQLHNDVPPVSGKPVLHAGLGSTSTRLSDHLGTLSAVVILNSQWGPDSLYCCPFFCCPSNCSLHCVPCRHSLKERTEQKRKEKTTKQKKTNENNLHAPPCRHAYAQAKLLYKLGLVLQGKHMLRKLSAAASQ